MCPFWAPVFIFYETKIIDRSSPQIAYSSSVIYPCLNPEERADASFPALSFLTAATFAVTFIFFTELLPRRRTRFLSLLNHDRTLSGARK